MPIRWFGWFRRRRYPEAPEPPRVENLTPWGDQEEVERQQAYENDQFYTIQNASHSIQVEVDTVPYVADVFQTMYREAADDRTRERVLTAYAGNFGGDVDQARILIEGDRVGIVDDMRQHRDDALVASRLDRINTMMALLTFDDLQKVKQSLDNLLEATRPEPEERPSLWDHLNNK